MREEINKIIELQEAVGTKAKQKIISDNIENECFKKILFFALNPFFTYKLSEKTLNAGCTSGVSCSKYNDIFEICMDLSTKRAINDATAREVCGFLNDSGEYDRAFYIKLLSKTLRLGVTSKTVNKVIPGLIPEWEVQQAYPIDKYPLKNGEWFSLTQKLNGVRATYYDGKLYARSGVPYSGLDHIIEEIQAVAPPWLVFDGELTLKNKGKLSDNEAFRAATGIINSDSEQKTAILYTVFDVLTENEFSNGISIDSYKKRRDTLDTFDGKFAHSVKVLPVLYSGTDQTWIDFLLQKMVEEDKEGLMVNLDVPYKCRRHNGILKVKRFYTMDLPIIACEEGSGRLSGALGAFVLDYKGNEVRVGSGFSDEQRAEFWKHRDDLIGTICEVKYKEISSDKSTGAESLQFPVFVSIRTDKCDISFG